MRTGRNVAGGCPCFLASSDSRHAIEIGKAEGHLELAVEAPDGLAERVGKPYVGPHIFSYIEVHHQLANEEIFGPVLTVYVYDDADYSKALDLCDSTSPYALTGAVFSQDRAAVRQAMSALRNAAGIPWIWHFLIGAALVGFALVPQDRTDAVCQPGVPQPPEHVPVQRFQIEGVGLVALVLVDSGAALRGLDDADRNLLACV